MIADNYSIIASVAQLDRAADFGSVGWGFKSSQTRILYKID